MFDGTGGRNQIVVENDVFRILQLTDFHSDQSEFANERTRADVRTLVARHRPHFLAVTGDLWCGDEHPDAAPMWMARDLEFLASLETPWAFTWGNHDYALDIGSAQERIASTAHYAAPTMTVRGECHIEILTGTSVPAWDLFFANTRDAWHLPDDLTWVLQQSAMLREQRGRSAPAVLFFHIPLQRYQAAIDEGRAQGIALEEVLAWGDESDTGADLITATDNIRACFCGHSHRNDCWFEEDGVVFAYGRSTGYGGYGDDVKKGAKLITLGVASGELRFETVIADGTDGDGRCGYRVTADDQDTHAGDRGTGTT